MLVRLTITRSLSASARAHRSIGTDRRTPIDTLAQHRQLRWRQDRGPLARQRPDKSPALQPLRVKAQARTVPPQNLDTIRALAAEHEQVPRMRGLLQHVLHQHGQAIESFPHIGGPAGAPDLRPRRHRDHRAQPSSASANNAARPADMRSDSLRTRPLRNTTSTIEPPSSPCLVGIAALSTAATATGVKRASPSGAIDSSPVAAATREPGWGERHDGGRNRRRSAHLPRYPQRGVASRKPSSAVVALDWKEP